MSDLPPYYFRVRDAGAAVFRVDAENRQRRLELEPVAVVSLRSGRVRPHGDRALSAEDRAAIAAWVEERAGVLRAREADDARRLVDGLNRAAQWAQAQGTEDEVEAVTDALLLAMHDLRGVLARRRSERLAPAGEASG